jgi:hypothetical protein
MNTSDIGTYDNQFNIDVHNIHKIKDLNMLNSNEQKSNIKNTSNINNIDIKLNIKKVDEVPEYMRENYRTEYVTCRNHRECILNLFSLHVESVNAWTMVVSVLSVIFVSLYVILKFKTNIAFTTILILHCLAYLCHLPFSFGYHTFFTLNVDEHLKWRKYDVYGIILRSIVISFTLSFFTYKNIKFTILNTLLTLIIAIKCIEYFEEQNKNEKPLDKYEQGKLIGIVVLSFNIPILYNIYNCIKTKNYDLSFKLSLLIILTIIIFGGAYAFRYPDILFEPGTFNKIGYHHNIMHVGVIILGILEILYIFSKAKKENYIKTI